MQSIAGGAVVERAVRARLTAASDGAALGPARLLITKSGVQLELGRRRPGPTVEFTAVPAGSRPLTRTERWWINPRATVVRCPAAGVDYDVAMLPEDTQLVLSVLARRDGSVGVA